MASNIIDMACSNHHWTLRTYVVQDNVTQRVLCDLWSHGGRGTLAGGSVRCNRQGLSCWLDGPVCAPSPPPAGQRCSSCSHAQCNATQADRRRGGRGPPSKTQRWDAQSLLLFDLQVPRCPTDWIVQQGVSSAGINLRRIAEMLIPRSTQLVKSPIFQNCAV